LQKFESCTYSEASRPPNGIKHINALAEPRSDSDENNLSRSEDI